MNKYKIALILTMLMVFFASAGDANQYDIPWQAIQDASDTSSGGRNSTINITAYNRQKIAIIAIDCDSDYAYSKLKILQADCTGVTTSYTQVAMWDCTTKNVSFERESGRPVWIFPEYTAVRLYQDCTTSTNTHVQYAYISQN